MRTNPGTSFARAVLLLAIVLAPASPALAFTPIAGGGADHYAGPGGQTTRSAIAIAGVTSESGLLGVLTLSRFDDNLVGLGTGYTAMVGVPAGPDASLRAWGVRLVGDGSYSAWRFKAGPRFGIGQSSLGLYYSHYEESSGARTDGGTFEGEAPLQPWLVGRASAGFARVPGDLLAEQALAGVGWRPIHGLELSGDAGIARNGALVFTPGPSRLPLPILGGPSGGGTTSEMSRVEGIVQLGVRMMWP
jgi:hypothetical protein